MFGTRADLKTKLAGKKMFTRDDCPFCEDIATHTRIIWKGTYWAILYNMYPYIDGGKHTMLVPIRHVAFSHDISPAEYSELSDAYMFLRDFYAGDEYFSFTRESFAQRSVEHVHTHFLPGDLARSAIVNMLTSQ
jgi:diadenosine tetraphosphate (Ap4A) HIT family hydrolase